MNAGVAKLIPQADPAGFGLFKDRAKRRACQL
ncbi:hypothetical protein ACVMHZ_004484 [Bradyrhizobium liaoningense]